MLGLSHDEKEINKKIIKNKFEVNQKMEEKNTKILLTVVVILAAALVVLSIASFGKPKVTGAAIAGQTDGYEGVLFGKGLSFVDDITCKEYLLCFAGWDVPFAESSIPGPGVWTWVAGTDAVIINEIPLVPYANTYCVWSMFALLFYGNPELTPPFELAEYTPIPPNCLVQKDPTITTPPQVTPSTEIPPPWVP